ncbi:MAG TPA: hypothetical protein VGH03_14950 [Caulobacteraceae bacterium]|jgi:hypothetical protein
MRLASSAFLFCLTVALAGCSQSVEAPGGAGLCWHMAATADGKIKWNQLAQNQPDLEHCAAQLDQMRLRFMGLGSMQTHVTGAFQGQFLFAGPEGVYTSQSYNGFRYLLMVHSGDGRLVKPGAMPVD